MRPILGAAALHLLVACNGEANSQTPEADTDDTPKVTSLNHEGSEHTGAEPAHQTEPLIECYNIHINIIDTTQATDQPNKLKEQLERETLDSLERIWSSNGDCPPDQTYELSFRVIAGFEPEIDSDPIPSGLAEAVILPLDFPECRRSTNKYDESLMSWTTFATYYLLALEESSGCVEDTIYPPRTQPTQPPQAQSVRQQ